MVICVSGNYRSGKSGLSSEISKKLGLSHYSMRSLKEKQKTEYNTDFVDWSGQIEFDENIIIDNNIVEIAKKGNCLLDFRYSAILCKKHDINYIGIWVISDLESRIYGNSYCWNKSYDETNEIILSRESKEKETCAILHNTDYSLSKYYKYFIDLSKYWYPIEQAVLRGFLFENLVDEIADKIRLEECYNGEVS